MKRILVLGGYGNFGKRIGEALLRSQIPITVAGRNGDKAQQLAETLSKTYPQIPIQWAQLDTEKGISSYLSDGQHEVIVNTCGPFQSASYQVVQDAIMNKVHYIDLADGRDFVKGMCKFSQAAKQAEVTVIGGASSVPGLSSAILQQYKAELSEIQEVKYGISPGQRTTRGGLATVRGVMSYIGKPIRPFPGANTPVYGWQDLYRQKYPGLGYRWFGNCEVPDLDLLPPHYKIKNIRFSAGMESSILHFAIWLSSWLIRWGIPLNLVKHAQFLLNFSHWAFDWMGTDAGGLHMIIKGKNREGKPYLRKWYIIVKDGDGPNVPTIPAIILARKLYRHQLNLAGVHPCVGLVTLSEYLQEMNKYATQTYTYLQ